MLYDAIDHVILPVADIERAADPFRRLGLTLFPGTTHQGRGTRNSGFFVGEGDRGFYVELLAVTNADEARRAGGTTLVDAIEQGRGVMAMCLRVSDIQSAVRELQSRGLNPAIRDVIGGDGQKICQVAEVCGPEQALTDLRLIQYFPSYAARHERRSSSGLLSHKFPLKRLDHLAAVAPDLERATRFWVEVLGVPVAGEVRTPAMIIHQMRIGDAVFELLGPATPDSPIASRTPGMASMAAFEVSGLQAAVDQARAAGFTAPDPGPGALPATRVSTIPAGELSGISLQMLEYVL